MPTTPADVDTHTHRFLQALTYDCLTVPEIIRFSIDEELISPAAIQLATHLFEIHEDAFEELLVHAAKETIQRVMEHLDGTTSISHDQRAVKLVDGTEPAHDLCDTYSAAFLATWTTNTDAPAARLATTHHPETPEHHRQAPTEAHDPTDDFRDHRVPHNPADSLRQRPSRGGRLALRGAAGRPPRSETL